MRQFFRFPFLSVCLVLLTNSENLLSQINSFIDGKIVNSSTSEPVPFATIKLKNRQLGVFANAEGDFKVARDPEFQSDSLIITCIGFKQSSISFKDLKAEIVNIIFLTPAIYGLDEVKVLATRRELSSVEIIGKAIRNIKTNYPKNPFSYIGYYRDYQKKDSNYINLNEAIIQTLDNGFLSESMLNKYRLLDFKKNLDFPRMNISPYYDTIGPQGSNKPIKKIPMAKIGDQFGNELFILMVHDPIRNFKTRSFSFINTFSDDFLFNHEFSKPTKVFNNNLLLYKINFNGKPRITGDTIQVSGAIYIQPKDYSIHKLEYSCSYRTLENEKKEIFNVDIEYGYENSVGSIMRLKYISFNNIFHIIDRAYNTYFRILNSYWDPSEFSKSTMVFVFNNKIDPESAIWKKNYEILVGGKKANISRIEVKDKMVYVRLKDENIQGFKDSTSTKIKNIKDVNGNYLDERKVKEFKQYRELFVLENNKSLSFNDSCYLQSLPLEQNCVSKYSDNHNYWMNTPAKIKMDK